MQLEQNWLLVINLLIILLGGNWSVSKLIAAEGQELSDINVPQTVLQQSAQNVTATSPETVTKSAVSSGGPKAHVPVRQPPPTVRLNKCCHMGEYFDKVLKMCVAGSSENWIPLIFLIQPLRYYIPQGSAPSFIIFTPNVKPTTAVNQLDNSIETNCSNVADLQLFSGSGKFIIFSNGSLYLRERAQLIRPRSYCVDRDVALVCYPPQQQRQNSLLLKLNKCCGKYGSYDAQSKTCAYRGKSATEGRLRLNTLNESQYQTVYGFPNCADEHNRLYAVAGDWKEAQLNLTTGSLHLPHKDLKLDEYCLEHLQQATGVGEGSNLESSTPVKIIACSHHFAPSFGNAADNQARHNMLVRTAILNGGIVVSVVFLAATLVAGYMMPSAHHALHWHCQIYYVFCLFVGKFLFAYTQLSDSLTIGSGWCLVIASVMHFFFLSAFFWLNSMCFNIWWTFRDFRPSSLERNQELLRLRLYSAYAWGIPFLICAIATCVDQLPETHLVRPGFGERNCWFKDTQLAIFVYFFGPIGLLLCANIVLFVSTTHQLTWGLWKRDDVKSTTEKTALGKVCLKLVVVMGVTWIAEVLSAIVGGPDSIWFITDLINALQGVLIFIVVGCQPQVWTAFRRVCCPRLQHDITNTTNGVQHSSSSQGLPSMGGCGAESTQNTTMNSTNGGTAVGNNTNLAVSSSQLPAVKSSRIPMETVC